MSTLAQVIRDRRPPGFGLLQSPPPCTCGSGEPAWGYWPDVYEVVTTCVHCVVFRCLQAESDLLALTAESGVPGAEQVLGHPSTPDLERHLQVTVQPRRRGE